MYIALHMTDDNGRRGRHLFSVLTVLTVFPPELCITITSQTSSQQLVDLEYDHFTQTGTMEDC